MSSPLDRLSDLRPEPRDAREFDGLKKSAAAFLSDARNRQISLGGRFTLVYDAAYAYSLAALRYCGYRAKNRYIVFQALPHTLGLGPEVWRVLAKAHELRNAVHYHGDFSADSRIVADVITACEAVQAGVDALPRFP